MVPRGAFRVLLAFAPIASAVSVALLSMTACVEVPDGIRAQFAAAGPTEPSHFRAAAPGARNGGVKSTETLSARLPAASAAPAERASAEGPTPFHDAASEARDAGAP